MFEYCRRSRNHWNVIFGNIFIFSQVVTWGGLHINLILFVASTLWSTEWSCAEWLPTWSTLDGLLKPDYFLDILGLKESGGDALCMSSALLWKGKAHGLLSMPETMLSDIEVPSEEAHLWSARHAMEKWKWRWGASHAWEKKGKGREQRRGSRAVGRPADLVCY